MAEFGLGLFDAADRELLEWLEDDLDGMEGELNPIISSVSSFSCLRAWPIRRLDIGLAFGLARPDSLERTLLIGSLSTLRSDGFGILFTFSTFLSPWLATTRSLFLCSPKRESYLVFSVCKDSSELGPPYLLAVRLELLAVSCVGFGTRRPERGLRLLSLSWKKCTGCYLVLKIKMSQAKA